MIPVYPKKHLGQHFLTESSIAERIVDGLECGINIHHVLEIGPGMGILTDLLFQKYTDKLSLIEIDRESVDYLDAKYPERKAQILHGDFLKLNIAEKLPVPLSIIGNFPYNISSQILFNVWEQRQNVPLLVGMFQYEVARRIASKPGNKEYGILSVLLQAFYEIEFLFAVEPHSFTPPPKVKSGVLRMIRNEVNELPCNEKLFKSIVKAGFNQRRKVLRNALYSYKFEENEEIIFLLKQRAEQLGVAEFIKLTQQAIIN